MAHDVFISYSTKDHLFANAVCARAEQHGIRCWIAPRDATPGEGYGASIMQAIRNCRVFVLIHSGYSDASKHVRNEVHAAHNADVVILPVRIADFVPSDEIAFFIGRQHWLDAITPPRERQIEELCLRIRANLEFEPSPAPSLTPPPPKTGWMHRWRYAAMGLAAMMALAASIYAYRPDSEEHDDSSKSWIELKDQATKAAGAGDFNAAVKSLDAAVAAIRTAAGTQPLNDTLHGELAEMLRQDANYSLVLNRLEPARKNFKQAREEAAAMNAALPRREQLLWNIALDEVGLARNENDRSTAAALMTEAVERAAAQPGEEGLDKGINFAGYVTSKTRAAYAQSDGNFDLAQTALDDALRIGLAVSARKPDDRWWQNELVELTKMQGYTEHLRGNYAAAAAKYESALSQISRLDPGSHTHWIYQTDLANTLLAQNKLAEAKKAFQAALKIAESRPGRAGLAAGINSEAASSLRNLGMISGYEKELRQAWEAYTRAAEISRQISAARPTEEGPRHDLADALYQAGYYSFWTQNEREKGLQQLTEAYRETRLLTTPDYSQRFQTASNLAVALRAVGRNQEATMRMDEARQSSEKIAGAATPLPAGINAAAMSSNRNLGAYAREDGQPDAARSFLNRALDIAEKILQVLPNDAFSVAERALIREELAKLPGAGN